MKEFLLKILSDPISGATLLYDDEKNNLHTESNDKIYPVSGGIPIILIEDDAIAKTPLHQNADAGFNYRIHYQKDAEAFDYFDAGDTNATRIEIKRLHETITNKIPAQAQIILDAGCGNGWLAKHSIKKNRMLISMDISTSNPAKAIQNYPSENHAALIADVFHIPLKNNSLDGIVAAEIMEHVHDPKLFVKKLIEKLKPGGKLIITTPYNEKIEYYLCVHCNLPTPKNAHLHSFNKENIGAIIGGNDVKWKAKAFGNKFLIKTRVNVLLRFLPFGLWNAFDAAVNKIIYSPTRFIIEIIKE